MAKGKKREEPIALSAGIRGPAIRQKRRPRFENGDGVLPLAEKRQAKQQAALLRRFTAGENPASV